MGAEQGGGGIISANYTKTPESRLKSAKVNFVAQFKSSIRIILSHESSS